MLLETCRILKRFKAVNVVSTRCIRLCCFPLYKNYEAEGKTRANILNNDEDVGLTVNGYSQVGFRLNNGLTVLGPMVIFPKSVLSWHVTDANDISEDTLCLFTILAPKLDILILGTGDDTKDLSLQRKLFPFMRKYKLNLEVLPTYQACTTFNFLNSEGRYIAAAMIPPQTIRANDDDLLQSKLRYQNLYERE